MFDNWELDVIRLATSPEPYIARNAHSVLAVLKANITAFAPLSTLPPRPVPGEPNPEPNPEPDSAIAAKRSDVNPADWDTLFHAIMSRLQACSGPATFEPVPEHQLGVSASFQATLQECVTSLNRLHADLGRERQQRH